MSSNLYSQGFGTTSSSSFPGNSVSASRSPSSSDIQSNSGRFSIGQLWVNTQDGSSWQLVGFSTSNGIVSATWSLIGGSSSDVNTLSGDAGTASPIAGDIQIAGGSGITTSAAGNIVTVALSGGSMAIDTVGVDTSTPPGTNPVLPNGSGTVTITGAQIAAGITPNVIRTDSTAANTITIDIQRSQAVALSTVGDNGVSHFNSAHFSVDADGFVSLTGGGQAIDSIGVDSFVGPGTNPVLPDAAGLVSVSGGQIAAASTANAIRTQSIAANSYVVEIQRSKTEAATTVGSNGICHFSSAQFSVDANGFVELAGGGLAVDSIGVQTGTNPIAPTAGGLVTIDGATVAAGTNPVRTDGTGPNTMAVEVQISQAIVATDATKVGLCNFNSSHFTVDANGFVELSGGGLAIDSIGMQTGTSPITPDAAGLLTLNGAVVAAGTNPIRTDGTGANTGAIEVQISQAIAATDATKIGLSNFNSAHFLVDANGFVGLLGGGQAIDSVAVQTGLTPVGPTVAGLINIDGAVAAAGTNPVRTNGTGINTLAVEVQTSQAIIATDATKIGLCNFNSTHFSVDANGFVELVGGGQAIDSFVPDAGTNPVVPAGTGAVTMSGSGSITTIGGLNSLTTQLTGLSIHNVLVGAGTTTITNVPPSATSGVPLISQGVAADPAFGTAVVAGGGTGATSFTDYAVICGGTTPTGTLQSIAGVGTTGQVLTSNGAAALPTFQTTVTGPGSSTDNALVRFDGTTGKVLQNGVMVEDDTGNLLQQAAVSGASLSVITDNTSDTASATAFHQVQVAGSTASDAYFKANIAVGQSWTFGLDNSDSDAFVVSSNASLGTTNVMHIRTSGEINYPLQPAFFAFGAGGADLTGDGTAALIGASTAWTEVYDQLSNFATGGTFTAPVTGIYHFDGCVQGSDIGVLHTEGYIFLNASNRSVIGTLLNAGAVTATAGATFTVSSDVDMDAGDTCTLTFVVSNSTKTVDVSTTANTHFSGRLVC